MRPARERLGLREIVVASIPDYLPAPARWIAPLVLARRDPPLWARVVAEDHVHGFRDLVRRTPAKPPVTVMATSF